jgi:uncharacterized protein YjbJ (UPF0337 family)
MNADQIKGKWKELQGEAKRHWGKLTDDDIQTAEGDADKLAGKIQQRYGKSKDEAEREVNEWINNQ